MKNLLIALCVLMVTSSFAFSQSWTSVEYNNTEQNYRVTITSDRTLMFYNTNPAARADQVYTATLTKDEINSLTSLMSSAGFLNPGFNPNYMDKGGSVRRIAITLSDGKTVVLNDNLGDKTDIANFQALVARIEKLVPSNFWSDNGIYKEKVKKIKKKKHHKKYSEHENENHED